MEQIPEIVEADLVFNISRRYHGMFEVSVTYAGMPMKRYPMLTITDMFLSCIVDNFPILGLWIFVKSKRVETIRAAYSKAIDSFIGIIKKDIADSIFIGEGV